jgi:hypothetical protein
MAVPDFRDTQASWEAIWSLCREHPSDIQEALHRVVDAAYKRLSIRKAGVSNKAVFKAWLPLCTSRNKLAMQSQSATAIHQGIRLDVDDEGAPLISDTCLMISFPEEHGKPVL